MYLLSEMNRNIFVAVILWIRNFLNTNMIQYDFIHLCFFESVNFDKIVSDFLNSNLTMKQNNLKIMKTINNAMNPMNKITSYEFPMKYPISSTGDLIQCAFGFRNAHSIHHTVRSNGVSFWSRNAFDNLSIFSAYVLVSNNSLSFFNKRSAVRLGNFSISPAPR